MIVHRCAFVLFFGVMLLTSRAWCQSDPAQSTIVCESKDNAEDAACRNTLKGLFRRKGDVLTLTLNGGKSKTYAGNIAACDGPNADVSKCVVFRILSYFPKTQSYLIEKGFYECADYLFVSRQTGSETVMSTIPVLSPNAKYLLAIDNNDACERKYDIAIWSLEADPPKLEFNYRPKQYESWELTGWEGDTHIKAKVSFDANRPYEQEAELVRTASHWTLQLGKRTERPR